MSREPTAADVAARLAVLRALYVPEELEEGRRRLAREIPRRDEPLVSIAERGLAELRALCELAEHLHRARPPR